MLKKIIGKKMIVARFALLAMIFATLNACQSGAVNNPAVAHINGAYIISLVNGERVRVTPYGAAMVRLQRVRAGEDFFADDHYEMVESHAWPRNFQIKDKGDNWQLSNGPNGDLHILINKKNLAASFIQAGDVVLQEQASVWQDNRIQVNFNYDDSEHFTGLGHTFYGREQSIDLKGKKIQRNYGEKQTQQAPLIVPFYLSSKGYGIFLNSTFSNSFNFGSEGKYSLALDDAGFGGRMDYFFIAGPRLSAVLDNYTRLTGRPRLPMKAIFGLQLSDKGHDHNSATPSAERWWREKITRHRAAGFPLDHVINDNRWRAGGGQRCESRIEWDRTRYPDPRAYAQWLKHQGLVTTLDFNRCIAQFSKGWLPEFNISETGAIDFKTSAPDLTNPDFRTWFWNIFYTQSLDPKLGFPGDALWIDEFDEMGSAPANMLLANGRSWAEMRNYWFFLIAKALVQEGWDKSALEQRPFVWVRGMTAGAQRYASLWSGDIYPGHADMQAQIRAMQLAGLSGFPYWGHDAGGFFNWETGKGPDDDLYMQWAMAFGSFSPIWKPHGMGESRWPLDRSQAAQNVAKKYSRLRYELMPYLYSAAHQAAATGAPIARAMVLDYQSEPNAWAFDLQYMWGDFLLVAPNAGGANPDASNKKELWLPSGVWFDYESKQTINGGKIITVAAPPGVLPIYVKQGAIITKRPFAPGTAFIDKQKLILDVYTGADGETTLIEDDDTTEAYRLADETLRTRLRYDHRSQTLTISGARGHYDGSPGQREYHINFFGSDNSRCFYIKGQKPNGQKLNREKLPVTVNADGSLSLKISAQRIDRDLAVQACVR